MRFLYMVRDPGQSKVRYYCLWNHSLLLAFTCFLFSIIGTITSKSSVLKSLELGFDKNA